MPASSTRPANVARVRSAAEPLASGVVGGMVPGAPAASVGAAAAEELGSNAWEKTTDWVGENWEYLAAGAMIVGGVALMFTGVGGPAGVALMAASGGLIAGGASAGIQKFTTGEVDWGQVAKDGLIGAAAGGLGAAAAVTSSARLAATNPLARELLINGAESVVSGGVERAATGGDLLNPRALATDLLTGGAAPAPGSALGAPTRTGDPLPLDDLHVYSRGAVPEANALDPALSVDQARAAAERQNLDTRSIDLRLREPRRSWLSRGRLWQHGLRHGNLVSVRRLSPSWS